MIGGDDNQFNKVNAPPPPPPVSPPRTPSTLLIARSGGRDENATSPENDPDHPDRLMSPPLLLEFEEGTPAAEALKANADVRVSKLRKVGRSTRLQGGVRVLKSAARTASGQHRRGDPAFFVPNVGGVSVLQGQQQQPPTIPEVDDEGGDEGASDHDHQVSSDRLKASIAADRGSTVIEGGIEGQSSDNDSASLPTDEDKSIHLDDSSTDRNKELNTLSAPTTPAQQQVQKHRVQHRITHAALPAAIAAACRAGEDMDRQRAALLELEHDNKDGELDTGRVQKLTRLFKPTEKKVITDDGSPVRPSSRQRKDRLTSSLTLPDGTPLPSYRRASLDMSLMPSEISIAETETCVNCRQEETEELLVEDLSDDGELLAAEDEATREGMPHIVAQVDPIVVEVPVSNPHDNEETKEEEFSHEEEDKEDNRIEFIAKAKKMISIRAKKKGLIDDEAFHFQGPKSVRKWVKRRRAKEESKTPRSYVTGKVIDEKHDQYITSIAVMFGMRTSIGRTNLAMSQTAHNERRWLDNDDTMAVEKYEFPPRGSALTPPHQLQHTFKFKDYSPLTFAYLRRMFGVNEYDFLLSVCGNANYIAFQSNAKSGQFFFYSPDGKYMIKTMTNAESKFLRRILPHYFRHCATNPNTFVTKFLGMYRVKLYHLRRNVKFVVMKSVYDTDNRLHQLFDLKGSSLGREAKPGDAVKKDNDMRRSLPDGAFIMESGLRERLQTQVKKDCSWLSSMKIMDYSMLIGVHNISLRTTKKMLATAVPQRTTISVEDGDDRSSSSFGASASNATLDRFLDLDDDDSYLDGANQKGSKRVTTLVSDEPFRTVRGVKSLDNADDESPKERKKRVDVNLEKAIEDMYWPFHRFYDIQGLRRMKPVRDSLVVPETDKKCQVKQIEPKEEKRTFFTTLCGPSYHPGMASDHQYNLKTFEKPLSHRKDGGFTMDTSVIDLPLKMSMPGAPHVVEYYDGKIIYMGIIDILQQFNIRKRVEAQYRMAGTKGWEAASCVHPTLYADRFVRFFDEYTEGPSTNEALGESNLLVSNAQVEKKNV